MCNNKKLLCVGNIITRPGYITDHYSTDTALIVALLLKKVAITIMDATTTPMNKAVARQLKDMIYTRLIAELFIPFVSVVLELCVP